MTDLNKHAGNLSADMAIFSLEESVTKEREVRVIVSVL